MKTYRERTDSVLKKVDEYSSKSGDRTVQNGGGTLSVKRGKAVALWTAFAACCVAIIIALNLVLFLPLPVARDISAYKDSEYYNLISVVNGLTYRQPQYKNNFEKWTAGLLPWGSDINYGTEDSVVDYPISYPSLTPISPDASPSEPSGGNDGITSDDSSSGNGDYVENTNNQVSGVIEGDILKCSNKYAFYLTYGESESWFRLNIYGLDGKDAALTSSHTIQAESGTRFSYEQCEMYLSADCNTITVITHCYNKNAKRLYTCLISLDVSNVGSVKENSRYYVSGSYISSRLTENSLLLFTNFTVINNPDFSDEAQFVPQTGNLDSLESMSMEEIVYHDNANSARYTVVCALDGKTLEVTSQYAFLSFSQEVYVSENNIYLTRSYNYTPENDTYYNKLTEITRISYTDGGLEFADKAEVPGTVLNQYSMDEYDGVFRVVTEVQYYEKIAYESSPTGYRWEYYSGASLFCLDLESFEICASLDRFSPNGEQVFSVRFDGKTAYVCTAIEYINWLCDPVFAIDLSDLENITYKDTGTITGYSLSLMKFKDDTLIGIGYGEWLDELKIELYRESENGVESVASFEKKCDFSDKFKAYYIDAENGLVGLSVKYIDENYQSVDEFILLLFDGYNLNVVQSVGLEEYFTDDDCTRALYLDGYIYVFTQYEVNVINWNA